MQIFNKIYRQGFLSERRGLLLVMLLLFACASLFVVGCGGTSSSKSLSSGPAAVTDDLDAGRIQGTVTSLDNGTLIKGAIVETFQNQAVAGEDGRYMLGPMPAGDYRVISRATGYSPIVKDGVRVLSGRITEEVNFQLSSQTASYSPDFAVLAVIPFLGTDGDEVTVYCKGCGTAAGRVTFNGLDATIINWNGTLDDRIVVRVPAEVQSGPVRVIINGETSKEAQPQLFIAKPVVLRAEPAIAVGGQTIRVYGRNFNQIYRFNRVRLKGETCATVDSPDSSTLLVTLPVNAKTGLLTVTIESNEYTLEGISDVIVTIAPELVHMSPKRSVADVPLTLYGYNFGSDRSIVKVLFGSYVIPSASFLSFSDNVISFKVPGSDVLAAGRSTEVKVQVNESQSNAMTYTAFNKLDETMPGYGIYDFATVSTNGTLKIARFRPDERIAFISVLAGNSALDLPDTYYYSFAGYLGGNFDLIPNLPGSIRLSESGNRPRKLDNMAAPVPESPVGTARYAARPALSEPASNTLEFFVRDFKAADPWNPANDILATATVKATGTHCLVYLDINSTALTEVDTQAIARNFDNYYATIATAFGVLDPPEGNIDAQARIVLFMTPLLNEAQTTPMRMAYFDARDKNPLAAGSAGTEVIFANPTGFQSDPEEFYAGLVESLQRMFYYNQKRANTIDYGTSWQNAGLSAFARQTVGSGFNQGKALDLSRVEQYLSFAEEVSLNHWPENPAPYNHGMQFLFTQYLFGRCGGYNAIKVLERGTNLKKGLVDVEQSLLPLASPVTAGLNEFFNDFCLALYCDNLNLPPGFSNYVPARHEFNGLQLRGTNTGINGLRGAGLSESPVNTRVLSLKGFGCRLMGYAQGNWGDLEVTIGSTPSEGNFKTWVIYYSAEQIASGT
ncbi:MAG: IPT/TIG domain-containing protein [Candidatus Riflebacteria bacterium]|nr:IPT/TIG domain-containing protein [Candidatus Riflebacteria bacterium]